MRNTTDTLRRAFESTVANWPLIAIRVAENFVFALLIIGSIIAAVVPAGIAAAFSSFDVKNAEGAAEAISQLLLDHWTVIIYVLLVASVLLLVLIAIHSFVEAGSARVFVDAERSSPAVTSRDAMRTFNMDRWLAGGRAAWWRVFWIYNIVWGIGGLLILIPLLLTIVVLFLVGGGMEGRIVVACGGLVLTFLIMIPIGIVLTLLTQKAITIAVARSAEASPAVRIGWAEIRRDLGRHFVIALIAVAVWLGGSAVIGSVSGPISFAHRIGSTPFASLLFAPAQIVSSVLQTIYSAAVWLWFMAAYVGLTEEK